MGNVFFCRKRSTAINLSFCDRCMAEGKSGFADIGKCREFNIERISKGEGEGDEPEQKEKN